MKVTIHPSSKSQIYSSWTLSYEPIKITKPINPKTSVKPLAVSKSLNISFNFNHECRDEEKIKPLHLLHQEDPENFDLPVAVRHSGTSSRYFWDGKELQLVSLDGNNGFSIWSISSFQDGMKKLGAVCGAAVRNFFLPREVSQNYLEYVKWKFLHRVFSSALQVLATQVLASPRLFFLSFLNFWLSLVESEFDKFVESELCILRL